MSTQTEDGVSRCISRPKREALTRTSGWRRARTSERHHQPLPLDVGGQRSELDPVGALPVVLERQGCRLTCRNTLAEASQQEGVRRTISKVGASCRCGELPLIHLGLAAEIAGVILLLRA